MVRLADSANPTQQLNRPAGLTTGATHLPPLQGEAAVRIGRCCLNTVIMSDSRFHSIDDALDALKSGRVVIVVDAEERENEGDFICAAESITPEQVLFLVRHGMGELCVSMFHETAE